MPDPLPLDRFPVRLVPSLQRFAEQIRAALGSDPLSITLFGTILQGAQPGGRHRLRSVLVLESLRLDALRRLAPAGTEFGRHGFAAPLVMTPDDIRTSLDSFPLELMEIVEHRHILAGNDYFGDLSFADSDVRLQ